jgi:two-component system LytT family response regulator
MGRQYNVVIVEDESLNIELIEHLINKYFPELIIKGIAKDLDEANILFQNKDIDIAFLDINIGDENIFELFLNIPKPKFQIIFITAYQDFAIEAIKLGPIDYLLKPLDDDEFVIAVNKAKEKCQNQILLNQNLLIDLSKLLNKASSPSLSKIVVSSNKEVLLLNLKDIISLSAQGQYTIFKLHSKEEVISSKSLGEYIKIINSHSFFRIHKSHIINLSHLVRIDKTNGYYCFLSNGDSLPVSQRNYKKLFMYLNA